MSMKLPALFAFWIYILAASVSHAQTQAQVPTQTALTQQSIEAKLQGPFLMLRGMWDGGKLTFDSQGNLVGKARLRPFSLSAVITRSVRVTNSGIEIKGERAALVFTASNIATSTKGSGTIDVVIVRDDRHPEELDSALGKVFSIGIDESLATNAPEYWRKYLGAYLHLPGAASIRPGSSGLNECPDPRVSASPDRPGPDENGVYRVAKGDEVIPPSLIHATDPAFTDAARAQHYQGTVVVGLVVNPYGRPQSTEILRPIGMGLDENAVAAVNQYEFKPATYQGNPVPVHICGEVTYRIW
jgi:TonB family protein